MATVPTDSGLFLPTGRRQDRLTEIAVMVAGAGSLLLVWLAIGDPLVLLIWAALLFGVIALGLLLRGRAIERVAASADTAQLDRALLSALVADFEEAVAITDRSGKLVTANALFEDSFGGLVTPPSFGVGLAAESQLIDAVRAAWRDGEARLDALETNGSRFALHLRRMGSADDYLLWRFQPHGMEHIVRTVHRFVGGDGGDGLGRAGVMMALVDADGLVLCANGALTERSCVIGSLFFHELLWEGVV